MITLTRIAALLLLLPMLASGQDVDETPMGEGVERHLSNDIDFMQWVQDQRNDSG